MKTGVHFRTEHQARLLRFFGILTVLFILASCGGGDDSGLPQSISLSATATSPSEAQISWSTEPTAGVIGYDLYRNGVSVFSTHISGTFVTDTGLSPGTRYCYVVYAIVFPLGAVSQSNEACITTPAYATGWTISDVANGYAASFVLSPTGGKHLAYRQTDGLHYAASTGLSWADELIGPVFSGGTSITLDNADTVHIVYGDPSNGGVYLASNASAAWSIETVNDTGGFSIAQAVDNAGKLHIVYSDYDAAYYFNHQIWYASNASGTWEKAYLTGSDYPILSPNIALDGSDALHVAYATGSGLCDLVHLTKSSGGVSWTTTGIDSNAGCAVSMDLDNLETPHVAYRKSMQVIQASLNAGTWNKEVVETLSWIGSDRVSIAVDASSQLHLSYGDQNSDLKYARNIAGIWTFAYLDKVVSTNIIRIGPDDHAYILYAPDSTGTLRLARSP